MQICLLYRDQILGQTLCEFFSHIGNKTRSFDYRCNRDTEIEICLQSVDLIIAEVNTANSGELNKIKHVHDSHPAIPIIVILDYCTVLSKDTAISHGIHIYHRKPISLAELELNLCRIEANLTGRYETPIFPMSALEK
jgi:DNA-binding NtrC family response regulator